MKKNIYIFIILITTFGYSFSQTSNPLNKEQLLKEWNKVDTFLNKINSITQDFSFCAALVYDGKIISTKKMGYANRETQLSMDEKSIHLWGSVSKLFTSVAILQLMEKGKLTLDDPVTKYIPELKTATSDFGAFDDIKIHHLLNHTSGISITPCYDSLEANGIKEIPSIKQILPYLKYAKMQWKPASKFRYSNGGYSILGVVVERVSKKEFTSYVTQNILKPLKMRSAHYGKTTGKKLKKLAVTYYQDKDNKIQAKQFNKDQGFQEGNGGVKSNMVDMAKFLNFLQVRKQASYPKKYRKILKWKTMQQFIYDINFDTPSNRFSIRYRVKGEGVMGKVAGFDYINLKGIKGNVYGHTGNIERYHSICYYRSEQPIGILVMMNTSGAKKTSESLGFNRLYSSLNFFITRLKLSTNFYNFPKKKLNKK